MLFIGLDIKSDGTRRLLVVNSEGQSERIDGGKELEQIYDRYLQLNCTFAELRAGVELVRRGIAVETIFARFAA